MLETWRTGPLKQLQIILQIIKYYFTGLLTNCSHSCPAKSNVLPTQEVAAITEVFPAGWANSRHLSIYLENENKCDVAFNISMSTDWNIFHLLQLPSFDALFLHTVISRHFWSSDILVRIFRYAT